ncbi:hypothetical protein BHE74_00022039 [Ensete ventricosum]|nr:hypothetical protein BHE74_00022039 [Ensete ventricosum]RZR79255.1 hypothetical protein BHM03_00004926 [Ensete ventricosum]
MPAQKSRRDPEITFESESGYPDHDDTLAITACIANARVKLIMIDTGSYVDILYLDAFQELGMTNQDLIPMTSTLTGFIGDVIISSGHRNPPREFRQRAKNQDLHGSFYGGQAPLGIRDHRAANSQQAKGDRLYIPPQHEVPD